MAEALGDLLSGASGHPINRPALDAAVMQGQALAGLRTAQTEDALLNAQRMREQQEASDNLEGALMAAKGADGAALFTPSQARFTATQMKFLHGGAQPALEAWQTAQKINAFSNVANPNAAPEQRLASDQALNPGANPYQTVEGQVVPRFAPGTQQGGADATPVVQQTPVSQANIGAKQAEANLHQAQANAGGFNPHAAGSLLPDQSAALSKAVAEGRLDPSKVNSRTAPVFAELEARNPGMNFNGLIADAALQRNATFQQKSITMEALPTIMSHMTSLGKKIGYSDSRTVGLMQQFMNGEFNDPSYAEYMPVRNDTLLSIAGVMRSVGMSDQAHKAEIEAAAPTMSPLALDAWLKGQMSALEPRLKEVERVRGLGGTRQGMAPGTGPGSAKAQAPSAADNDPLGIR